MEKGFWRSKNVGRETNHSIVASSLVHARDAGGSDKNGSDESGEKWLEYILKTELTELAGGLELNIREREESRKAPCFLVEPWVDAGYQLLNEETWGRAGQGCSRVPKAGVFIRVAMEMSSGRVFSQLIQRAAGCPKTSTVLQWLFPCEKVSLKMNSVEKQRTH